MKLSFRQGIVRYPQSGSVQEFLQLNAGVIDLRTSNGPTSVTFAHKDTDYFFSEGQDVPGAWGPFSTTPVWLYWDIDRATGQRTFGHTILQPTFSTIAPTSPAIDQHWFDLSTNTQKVWQGNSWKEVIRVFAAKFDGSTFSFLGTNSQLPYAGTQVGLNVTSFSGLILFDEDGNPIVKSSNGTFYTTETEFFSGATRVNGTRLESDVITAAFNESIPAYRVVKFTSNGRVALANYNEVNDVTVGISTQQGVINDIRNVIVQGTITNENWNWPAIGAPLFVETSGELTTTDPHVANPAAFPQPRVPVARVIGPRQIIFMQGLGGVGPRGPAGDVDNLPLATDTDDGVVRLSVPAAISSLPIVVGDNDPRLVGAPFAPGSHIGDSTAHDAEDIVVTPQGNITSADVGAALNELDNLIQNVSAGLDPKESVRLATVSDVGGAYNPTGGTSSTGSFSGAVTSVDGVAVTTSNRILVKDQTDPTQNGIYRVINAGTGSWERAADQDGAPAAEVSAGNFTFVEQGTTNTNTGWIITGDGIQTLNTDPINWVRFSGNFVQLSHLTDSDAHDAVNITNVPYGGSGFGTPANAAGVVATTTQGAVDELVDDKAQKAPRYVSLGDLPTASSVEGMVVWVTAEEKLYVSDGTSWITLVREDFSLPYDLAMFTSGPMVSSDSIEGAIIVPRAVVVEINAPGSVAFANTPPQNNTSYALERIPVGGGPPVSVGSVDFLAGMGTGTFTFPAQITLNAGDQLHMISPNPVDPNIEDVAVTIVGCASASPC